MAITLAITAAAVVAQQLFAPKPKKPAPIDRGKLDDARFSIPALGASVPKGWGTFRCAPIWIDHTPTLHTVQVTEGQSGGKGGGGTPPTADERKHIYTKSVIGVFHNGLIHKGVSKMWFGEKLAYNADLARIELDTSAFRYEAEHGVLAGGASVAAQSECSGGRKVTGLGSGGNVTLNVDVSAGGSYEIAVFYTSTADHTFKISVNGGGLNDLFCPSSGGAGEVTSEVIVLTLSSGANTIKFENSGAACPDLDRIDITPALEFTPDGEDPRGFTGITRPGRFGPNDPDYAWPVANESPLFSEAQGGVTNGGFYQAVLSEWGNPTIRFYNGSELQEADPISIALRGLDLSPGYRGLGIVAIDNIQLQNGQMPNVTLEVQQGVREVPAVVADIYNEVGVGPENLDLSALSGLLLGNASGFDPGTYSAITWTGLNNATQTGGGAITKTSGTNNTWNAYANSGDSVSSGADASIRFTAGSAGTYMLGFSYTTTPGSALPHPYDQVPFAVILNQNSNPSQEAKNAIQLSIGGSNNTFDVGVWSPGDKFQVEYRNGRFMAYQNGLALTGYTPPVPSTFPLTPLWMGYATGGGPSAATFATGANIGTEPIISNGGGLFMESPGPAADLIGALMLRFQFSLPEVDGKVKAVLNNASSDLTIPYTDLRAHRGNDMPKEDMVIGRVDPLKLAKRTTVTYSDPAYSYHTRTQSEIRLFGPQQGTHDITLPMIETAQNMKNLAIVISNREEIEGQTYRFTLGPKYQRIHQGTVLTINSRSNVTHTVRVRELGLELPAGIVDVEAVRQDAAVFSANGTPSDISTETPVVALPGNTKGVIVDAPLIDPENAATPLQPAVYIAMSGRGSGTWPGGFFYREFPFDSDNYQLLLGSDKPSQIAITAGALGSHSDPTTLDTVNTLELNFYDLTELETVTLTELENNSRLNLIAVLNGSGDWEYLQFQTVTPGTATAPFLSNYVISDLLRGRFNTAGAITGHASGKDAVIMNSMVKTLLMSTALLGVSCNYKFVTVGMGLDIAPVQEFTWRGFSMKEPAPTNVEITKDANSDWIIKAQIVPGPPDTMSVEIWSSTDRSNPANRKRTLTATPGTTQAAILASTDGEFDPVSETTTFTNHAFKNNFAPAGSSPEGFSGTSVQAIERPWQRFDFEMAFDNVSDGGFISDLPSSPTTFPAGFFVCLHERANAESPYAVPDFADCPLSIEWLYDPDGIDGTVREIFRSYDTTILDRTGTDAGGHPFTMVSGEVTDNSTNRRSGPRYSFSLNGGELAIYQNFVPGGGNKHLVKVIPAALNYPLRLSAWVGSDHFYLRNVMFAGATQHSTIYSKREQDRDFGSAQTKLYLRLFKDGQLVPGIPLDIETITIP